MCYTANLYKRFLRICVLFSSLIFLLGGCAGSSSAPQPQSRAIMEPVFQEAQQLHDSGQFQRAIEVWEQIPPSNPRYMDAQLGIRSARLQIDQIRQQQLATSRKSSQINAYISQAEELERQGDLAGAVKKYEEARALDPKNIFLYNKIEELYALLDNTLERHARLGDIYLAQKEYEKSRAEWERLLLLDPSNEKAKQRLADLEVLTATSDTVFFTRGIALLEKGLINAAKAEFEKAYRVNPANEDTLMYLSKLENISFTEYQIKRGETLSSIAQKYTGNPSSFHILADFNAIVADVPLKIGQIIKIPHVLGFKKALAPEGEDIVLKTADSEANIQTESREIRVPEDTESSESLERTFHEGVVAFHEGKYREAVSILEKVLLRDPENEEAYRYFVRATENVRRGTSAVEVLTTNQSPEQPEQLDSSEQTEIQNLIQTGKSYQKEGELKKAIATFEQAYQLAPENPEIFEYLEETRYELKKTITAYLNEGIKLFNQDSLEGAILEWNKVLELDPSNRQAAEYKERAETMLNTLASQQK
jgi:tetratricopeptide (TPR) repeat protein